MMVKQLENILMSINVLTKVENVCVCIGPLPPIQRGAGSHCRGKPQTATISMKLSMVVKVGEEKQAKMQRFF